MVPVKTLKQFPVFVHLPDDVVGRLAKNMEQETFSGDGVVFPEGKPGDAIYFVVSGEVIIKKIIDAAQGLSKVVAVLGPGEFFGEMALLESVPRSASAVAHGPVTLFRLSKQEFERLLDSDAKVAMELFRGLVGTLSLRLRQTTREMVSIFEVGRAIAQQHDIKPLAEKILNQVCGSFEDGVFGGFFHWNEFAVEYELLAVEGPIPQGLKGNRLKVDPLVQWLAQKKECLISQDWGDDDRFQSKAREDWPGIRSLLAVPLVGSTGLLGFILIGHGEKANIFVAGHRQMVAGISNLVTVSLENASFRQDAASRQRLESAKQFRY